MKTYHVELKPTSYTITVDAESEEEAAQLAWKQIDQDYYRDDGSWEIESIEPNQGETA